MMNNLLLRQSVIDELAFEPSVDAAHIGVAVDGGIVTLTGHVATYAEKTAAERAVLQLRGVTGVAADIRVRFPFEKKTADDEIAGRAVKILAWTTALPEGRIHVKVEDGWITLSGDVDSQLQRNAAAEAIGRLTGVCGMSNLIEIKPGMLTGDTRKRIEEALRRNVGVDASNIRIGLESSKVILRGKVRSWHERDVAEWAAWSAPGVTAVEDLLVIS